jgi:heme-degrading monooxygenase HmoA
MMAVIFRSRLRPEAIEEYGPVARELAALSAEQPGYMSAKTFTAADGERVTLAFFEDDDAVRAWATHPRHREVQQMGRERFYSRYSVQVCSVVRDYSYLRETHDDNNDNTVSEST